MSKIDDNKKQKKEALFSTAYNLFTTKGIQGTSISDIVNQAGVAKGTFYLYFADKYDIRDKLIIHKAEELLTNSHSQMVLSKIDGLEKQLLFLTDYILDYLNSHKALLHFISKNLIFGIFHSAMNDDSEEGSGKSLRENFQSMIEADKYNYEHPEVMVFTIIELLGSTAYHSILYSEPLPIDEYKPYLHEAIKGIMRSHRCKEIPVTQ